MKSMYSTFPLSSFLIKPAFSAFQLTFMPAPIFLKYYYMFPDSDSKIIKTLFSLAPLSILKCLYKTLFEKLMWLYTGYLFIFHEEQKIGNDIVMSSSTNLKGHAVHYLMGKTNLVNQNLNHLYSVQDANSS